MSRFVAICRFLSSQKKVTLYEKIKVYVHSKSITLALLFGDVNQIAKNNRLSIELLCKVFEFPQVKSQMIGFITIYK